MQYLKKTDSQIYKLLKAEERRQKQTLMMIPSENHTSQAVRKVVGSCLQDKYCEGFPFKRYYQGQENFDKIETLCQKRSKKLFNVPYVNVQALSGAPANSAVYFGLLKPGEKIMSLRLDQGGHISHGLAINFSGKFYKTVFYYVDKNGFIDYKAILELAKKHKPKLIIAGITSYPRVLNFKKFAEIAQSINAYLMADVAHVAGLILSGVYPDPVPYCDIITTTTHKTLRGPRGALIMITKKGLKKDPDLPIKIDKAVFPGLQGGPHENNIAGIAVALKEASSVKFRIYGQQIVKNAKVLSNELIKNGFRLCSGGTDTHLILIDLRNFDILGNTAAEALEEAGIICNRNAVPFDHNPPYFPSGLRLGTPGPTSRGMKEPQMKIIASLIESVIKEIAQIKKQLKFSFKDEKIEQNRKKIIFRTTGLKKAQQKVKRLCKKFVIKKEY